MKKSTAIGLLGAALAMSSAFSPPIDIDYKASNQSRAKSELTKKQRKERAKSKRARKARRKNR